MATIALSTSSTRSTVRGPVGIAAAATALGAVVAYGYGVAAQAVLGPLQAGDPGADHAVAIPPSALAIATLMCGVLGLLITALVAWKAARPARAYVRITVALTALSLLMDVFASHTSNADRIALGLSHLLVAAVIIPLTAKRLAA